MDLDNNLINNRPQQLFQIPHYKKLPKEGFYFEYQPIPGYLNMDLFSLIGIAPKTADLLEATGQHGFFPNPSKAEIEFYAKKGTKFQMVSVVANVHTIKKDPDGNFAAYPYCVSFVPGPKRGIPEIVTIEKIARLDLDKIDWRKYVYTDLSPFKPVMEGFFADFSIFANSESFTDTIGFVLETFFLPMDIDYTNVAMPGPNNVSVEIGEKYNKYRRKRYYKPFTDITPRKIWGCDSPIELFLIQGLAARNLFPIIQTSIFKNGQVYDNFYHMMQESDFIKGDELITEVDLYFPDKKLAIFCDSIFHRGGKNQLKDQQINEQLQALGIRILRLEGKMIINELTKALDLVIDHL